MNTLFLQAPSYDGFDGGTGSRCQGKREIRSLRHPMRLARPAARVPDSRVHLSRSRATRMVPT